jgi:hypothetical protein
VFNRFAYPLKQHFDAPLQWNYLKCAGVWAISCQQDRTKWLQAFFDNESFKRFPVTGCKRWNLALVVGDGNV